MYGGRISRESNGELNTALPFTEPTNGEIKTQWVDQLLGTRLRIKEMTWITHKFAPYVIACKEIVK